MTQEKHRTKWIIVGLLLLGLAGAFSYALMTHLPGQDRDNLARGRGVKVDSDSEEGKDYGADKIIDGDCTTSRWSSENNRESANHAITLAFPKETTVAYVVLYWERRNVVQYALEASLDGETYFPLTAFDTAPETNRQEIVLEEPVMLRYLRLVTSDVQRREEDLTLYYQNVSLYEMEVYAKAPAAYRLEPPELVSNAQGELTLKHPEAPEGYEVVFLGADLEQVIGADGRIYAPIEAKEVCVGYRVIDKAHKEEEKENPSEIAFTLTIPAKEDDASIAIAPEGETVNPCPEIVPQIAQWRGGVGSYEIGEELKLVFLEDSGKASLVKVFDRLLQARYLGDYQILHGTKAHGDLPAEAMEGAITFCLVKEDCLGKEGYEIRIAHTPNKECQVRANTETGLYYGLITLLQMLQEGEKQLPCGEIRDYPRYAVRGFGIDVARKKVSLETLYEIVETMSYYKLNDLQVHLNDNTILATSNQIASVEEALGAESAFRIESRVQNAAGEPLTAKDYAYTKEEFATFIQVAKQYGVNVVPEFDTPAHCLSLTRLFPEYALKHSPESVDQLDIRQPEAVELVKTIWAEMLVEEGAPFAPADTVHIGMDEYYGDGEAFRTYLCEMTKEIKKQDKTVRMWASLGRVAGTQMPEPWQVQMNVWSLAWASPRAMYEAGYGIINTQSNYLYIIPGGGYDYLDVEKLWTTWAPNQYEEGNHKELLPAYSKQLLGAAYMLWNDTSGKLEQELTEEDLFLRFQDALPVFSTKLWGVQRTQEMPMPW